MGLASVNVPPGKKSTGNTIAIHLPSQRGSVYYDGNEQSPAWNNCDPAQISMTGELSAIDAGTYTVTCEPLGKCVWLDGTHDPKIVTWKIGFDVGATLNDTDWETISAISKAGLGDTYFDIGDCKEITLDGTVGTLALSNQKLCVFILHFNYPMNGTAENNIIWGGFKTDIPGYEVVDIALRDESEHSYMLYGIMVGLSDDGTKYFNMNHWGNSSYGGWKGCDLRYDILGATSKAPSDYGKKHTTSCVGYNATAATLTNPKANTLLAALPSDFRNVLRLWSRWIDAKGNGSNTAAAVEETVDAITLLAEFEVLGEQIYANEYEQYHQTRMDYFNLGGDMNKYEYVIDEISPLPWWLASPDNSDPDYPVCFCYLQPDAGSFVATSDCCLGLVPAFKT